jgi:hypothetical protein
MGDPAVEHETFPVLDEREAKTESWRFEVLARAGYPSSLAELVARSRADLHVAVDLVSRGCDPELAARIVL